MRKEATLEAWKRLYEAATKIRELEPWELLWDMDIIGIQVGDEPENTVFYSILGKAEVVTELRFMRDMKDSTVS